jgi:hypothetical protein
VAFARSKGRRARYGWAHQQVRQQLLAEYSPTDPCRQVPCLRPGQPLGPVTRRIHLGHDSTGTRYIGLVHDVCNTSDGARRGAIKVNTRRESRRSRDWA